MGRLGRTIVVLLAQLVLAHAAHGDLSDWVKEWQQVDLNVADPWNDGKCQMAFLTERRIALTTAPDRTLQGVFVSNDYGVWLEHNNQTCVAPGESTFSASLMRHRGWSLAVVQDGPNSIKIEAGFEQCSFNRCGEPGLFKSDFSASARLVNGELYFTSPGSGTVIFLSYPTASGLARSVSSQLDELMEPLERGSCNDYINSSLIPALRAAIDRNRARYCELERDLRRAMDPITERNLLSAFYVNRISGPSGRSLSAVFTQRVLTHPDGSNSPRIAVLERTLDGRWLIALRWGL